MTIEIDDKLLAFCGAAIIVGFVVMLIYVWIHDLYVMYKRDKPKERKPFYSNIQKVGDYNVLITRGILSSVDRQIPTTHFYDAHFWVKDGVVAKNLVLGKYDKYPVGTKLTEEEITSIIKDN